MKLSLIGPGEIDFHYMQLLGFKEPELTKQLKAIAKAIAESNAEIILLPDRGVSLEIAKLYRQQKGKKTIAALPASDKTFGIKHLEPYLNLKINKKALFTKVIDTKNWFKHDLIKGLLGNALFYLGDSPGTNGELNYAIYLYKLLSGDKQGVVGAGKYLHPEIKAGTDYTILVYSPFLKNKKLSKELESYIKKFKIKLIYIKDPYHLKKILSSLK
jgi:hypothetical protein